MNSARIIIGFVLVSTINYTCGADSSIDQPNLDKVLIRKPRFSGNFSDKISDTAHAAHAGTSAYVSLQNIINKRNGSPDNNESSGNNKNSGNNKSSGNKKNSGNGKSRPRRFAKSNGDQDSAHAVINTRGPGAVWTFIKNKITSLTGGWKESTIRSSSVTNGKEGKVIFTNLNDENLDQSFKDLVKTKRLRTGDIISCRIPGNRMAEHYVMVCDEDEYAEVTVNGDKNSNDGKISIDVYSKNSYYESKECLYHENTLIKRALVVDEKNQNKNEKTFYVNEIFNRMSFTLNATSNGALNYNFIMCNCQDVVLYWAYGLTDNYDCIKQFFPNREIFGSYNLLQLAYMADVDGSFAKQVESERVDYGPAFLG